MPELGSPAKEIGKYSDVEMEAAYVFETNLLFDPQIAPFRFAGALIGLFVGARDCAIFDFALGRAKHKLNVPAMLAGMADDACCRRWRIDPGSNEIRKFLIFIAERSAFQLAMLRRAFHALREMAPITGCGHGASEMMRAGSKDCDIVHNQRRPGSINSSKTARRSGFNEHKQFTGALPSLVEHNFRGGLRQFAQRVRDHY